MSREFRCQSPGRRELIRNQDQINAIDFVVVADNDQMPASLRQRILIVHMFFANGVAGLGLDNWRLRGGVRVVDPPLRWAVHMPSVDASVDPSLDAEALSWLAGLAADTDAPGRCVVIMLDGLGDFSRYTLTLRAGPDGDDPPVGFDRVLSEVELDLEVDCLVDFDCAAPKPCVTEAPEEPELDYLTRDFASFRRLMLDRAAMLDGDASQDPAALRTALIETLAYAADQLAYFQDAVATEAHLGTARLRSSVRRHARLLDYHMHDGCNARTVVALEVTADLVRTADEAPLLDVGAQFATAVPELGLAIAADRRAEALAHAPEIFEVLRPVRVLTTGHNAIALHTWGDDRCCLAAGSTAVTLVVPASGLQLAPGDLLLFEEIRDPQTGIEADADPERRHLVRLTAVSEPFADGLIPVDLVRVEWGEVDALPAPLFASSEGLATTVARANLALVDHGQTITAADAVGQRSFGLDGRARVEPTLHGELCWAGRLDDGPGVGAGPWLTQDPRAAVASLTLRGEGERWTPTRDLLASAASSREFVVERETDGRVWLRFGDDQNGRRPDPSTRFELSYRVGNGTQGNVGAESIAHILIDPANVDAAVVAALAGIRNPLAARGGVAPEPITAVKLYAPRAFRRQERAVTCADWAEVAGRHAEVQRAVASLRYTGSWHTIVLSVDRVGGRPVDAAFEAELLAFLDRFRLAGYDLEVVGPRFVPLDIELQICVAAGHLRDVVAREVADRFTAGLRGDGRMGFFHPDRFSFGDSVYASQLIAAAAAVPGVDGVELTRLQRWGRRPAGELGHGYVEIARLEVARCDNDRSLPDNGRLRLITRGGA